MNALENIWNGLDWSVLTGIVMGVIPSLLCITLHELSHGYAAYRLGDNTARIAGRLTLNPVRHIDWMGLAAMVLFHFGWAKPVPVDMRNFKNPRRDMAITALAGPAANFVIAVVFLFLYGLMSGVWPDGDGALADVVIELLWTTAYLSLSLGIFNLLPISPLDGSKVLFAFLSDEAYFRVMRYERYGMIVLLVLTVAGAFSGLLSVVVGWVYEKLFFIARLGFRLVSG